MGARQKLNAASAAGSLFVAGVLGGLMESWAVFFIALIALLVLDLIGGDIRPTKPGRWEKGP